MAVTRTELMDTANLLRLRAHGLRLMANGTACWSKDNSDALNVAISDLETELSVLKDGLEELEVAS